MNIYTKILVLLFFFVFFTGCNVYQYVPSSLNVPLFKEKGEIRASACLHNFQAAYSVSNHFAILSNYAWYTQTKDGMIDRVTQKEGEKVEEKKNELHDFELAGEYMFNKNNFCFELIGGLGYGSTFYKHSVNQRNEFIDYDYYFKANPLKKFAQVNCGLMLVDGFEIAISTKIIDYQYLNISNTLTGFSELIEKPFDLNLDGQNNIHLYFVQPALTVRNMFGRVGFQAQCGLNKCLNYSDINVQNAYVRFSIYLAFP